MNFRDMLYDRWREPSLYTAQQRAIPNLIDGLKPVHRFLLYRGQKMCKGKFEKVAAVGSSVASAGYHHGEAASCDALAMISADWNNNLPLFLGDGWFGDRLERVPAAGRYIFCKVNPLVDDIYKDTDIAPEHPSKDHLPPKYYLPLIPMVLVNGIKGIATGYATDIPSCDPRWLVESCLKVLDEKAISEPKYMFPMWKGSIQRDGNGWVAVGKYELKSKTKLVITEVAPSYDREGYIEILDKLQEKGKIVSYDDCCSDGQFKFEVTLKRNYDEKHIIRDFKLSQNINKNLTVINEEGNIEVFPDEESIIRRFVELRIPFYQIRIENEIKRIEQKLVELKALNRFISDVTSGKVKLQSMTKKELHDLIRQSYDGCLFIADVPVYALTKEEIEKNVGEIQEHGKRLDHMWSTTPQEEYKCDLLALESILRRVFKKTD